MGNKLKQQIRNMVGFIKNHKRISFAVSVFILLIVIFFLTSGEKKKVITNLTERPVPTATFISPFPKKIYYLNKLTLTNSDVNGYSWIENNLYYSNVNGIYDASGQEELLKSTVINPKWSNNGTVLFHSGKTWRIFDVVSKDDKNISTDLFYPSISPDGQHIADITGNVLTLHRIQDFSKTERTYESNLGKAVWSPNSRFVAIQRTSEGKTKIDILNLKLETQGSAELEVNSSIMLINSKGDSIFCLENDSPVIIDSNNNKSVIPLDNKSGYYGLMYSGSDLFFIEKKVDDGGMVRDIIWKYSDLDQLEYLTNSLPIAGKINPNITGYINTNRNTIPLIENGGKVWILSLIPNHIAFYDKEGLRFSPMSSKGGDYE